MPWYGVRSVIYNEFDDHYMERVVLWEAEEFDEALALAEDEAGRYATSIDGEHLGVLQAWEIAGTPGRGTEVFSLTRVSGLDPEEYMATFIDTGSEIHEEA